MDSVIDGYHVEKSLSEVQLTNNFDKPNQATQHKWKSYPGVVSFRFMTIKSFTISSMQMRVPMNRWLLWITHNNEIHHFSVLRLFRIIQNVHKSVRQLGHSIIHGRLRDDSSVWFFFIQPFMHSTHFKVWNSNTALCILNWLVLRHSAVLP